MLTFTDLKRRVESIIRVEIDLVRLAQYIDEAQQDVAIQWGIPAEEEYEVEKDNEEKDVPEDYVETIEVIWEGAEEPESFQRIVKNVTLTKYGKFRFPKGGHYKVRYLRSPSGINPYDPESKPEVHSVFHPDIVNFCVGRYWQDHAEGVEADLAVGNMYLNKFNEKVVSKATKLRSQSHDPDRLGISGWWL